MIELVNRRPFGTAGLVQFDAMVGDKRIARVRTSNGSAPMRVQIHGSARWLPARDALDALRVIKSA